MRGCGGPGRALKGFCRVRGLQLKAGRERLARNRRRRVRTVGRDALQRHSRLPFLRRRERWSRYKQPPRPGRVANRGHFTIIAGTLGCGRTGRRRMALHEVVPEGVRTLPIGHVSDWSCDGAVARGDSGLFSVQAENIEVVEQVDGCQDEDHRSEAVHPPDARLTMQPRPPLGTRHVFDFHRLIATREHRQ